MHFIFPFQRDKIKAYHGSKVEPGNDGGAKGVEGEQGRSQLTGLDPGLKKPEFMGSEQKPGLWGGAEGGRMRSSEEQIPDKAPGPQGGAEGDRRMSREEQRPKVELGSCRGAEGAEGGLGRSRDPSRN